MKLPLFIATFTIMAGCTASTALADVFSFTNNLPVPDGQPAGISDVENISSSVSQIGSVEVALSITGNFNGDLYCYLQHDGALSVLLNRVGRTAINPYGYADCGFNVLLSDTSTNGNIHTYESLVTLAAGLPLTGAWQPDGRTTSPATVLDTDPSTAPLSVFDGLDANGAWTLFIADMSPGGTSELDSWELILNPVPEPSILALGLLGAGTICTLIRWRRKGSSFH
jgi:subtilisin-like proprotein convertase family protein